MFVEWYLFLFRILYPISAVYESFDYFVACYGFFHYLAAVFRLDLQVEKLRRLYPEDRAHFAEPVTAALLEAYAALTGVRIQRNVTSEAVFLDELFEFVIDFHGTAGYAACSAAYIYLFCLSVDMSQKFLSVLV